MITPEVLDATRELRREGLTWRQIGGVLGDQLGVHWTTLRRHCGPDGTHTGPRRVVDAGQVLALYQRGAGQKVIAAELGVSRCAVRRRLAEAGLAAWPCRRPDWTAPSA